jgi:Zn-dependent protease
LIHGSWFIVFLLIAWSLAVGYFPRVGSELGAPAQAALGLTAALLFFAALLLHELAHSYIAIREGVAVRSVTLFLFGGVAQMAREPRTAGAEFRIAIAGPVTSVAIGLVFAALASAAIRVSLPSYLHLLFQYLALANLVIAAFNMLPAFPLDGGRVFRSAVWYATKDRLRATRLAALVGQGFAYVLVGLGAFRALGGSLVAGIWMAFIGWYLLQAAQASYQAALIRRALRGIEARDVMREDLATVPADVTLAEFVEGYLMHSRESEFCVMDDGHLRGMIGLQDVKRVPREQWADVGVAQAMTGEDKCPTIRPSQGAFEALMLLGAEDAPQLIVREGGRVIGTITRGDLLAFIRNRVQLAS